MFSIFILAPEAAPGGEPGEAVLRRQRCQPEISLRPGLYQGGKTCQPVLSPANCPPAGRDLEDGARHHHRAGRLSGGGWQARLDTELLFQQLPRPLQPPGGRGGRRGGSQVSRGRGELGAVHLWNSGHPQRAGRENIRVPRPGGLHPLPFLF